MNKGTYYERNKEKLKQYAKEYNRKKLVGIFVPKRVRVLGLRIKEKELKPFLKRISPELRDKIEENTRINNEKIKFITLNETKEDYLSQQIVKELIKV